MELLTTTMASLATPDQCEISSAEASSTLLPIAELEFQATLRLLVERARFLTAASGAAIALEEQGKLVYSAAGGDSLSSAGATVDTSKEPIAQCIDRGKPTRQRADTRNALFALAVPIIQDEKVIGLFELYGQSTFEDRDVESILRLAEMVNTAIDHRKAAEQVERNLFAHVAEVDRTAVVRSLWHAPDGPASEAPQQESDPAPIVIAADVRKCRSCGFPVSQGRSLCVECDQKIGHAAPLAELFSTPTKESWISAHGYTIASALITALAFAIIVWLR